MLSIIQKELEEKNKQIEKLQTIINQEQQLRNQEQQLRMITEQKLLALEQKYESQENKRGFWSRLFGTKPKENDTPDKATEQEPNEEDITHEDDTNME